MANADRRNPGGHGSINSLPTVKKLRREASGLELFGCLLRNKETRETARGISAELDGLVSLIDGFYRLLGDRNWVFSDALNLEGMRAVVAEPTPEAAERRLIEYLKGEGTLHGMITRLNRFPDMRPRMPLLERAERDYLEGRYYSSVLVTVSVMDGFVNDAFKSERRGLHAREAEELHTEDCVATIWDGLPSVQGEFTKAVRAREDGPVYEVHRHGIVHGMTTDYDNDVVASKAWCMFFAVGDWADSRVGEQGKAEEEPRDPIQVLRELSEKRARTAENSRRLDAWEKHHVKLEDLSGADAELVGSLHDFLEAWRAGNYGTVGSFFPNFAGRTPGKQAGEARESYAPHPIEGYKIKEVDRPAAAVAQARVRLLSPNGSWTASIRLSRCNGAKPAAEWEPGAWKVIHYGVDPFADVGEEKTVG